MTVGQLKKLLAAEDFDDDAPVVVPAFDHGFRVTQAAKIMAEVYDDGTLGEDWEEAKKRISVLYVGR